MQLKHLKLAGFKSFVDPTRISFPTNMVAVVGPNGCGKSNIIDAVRWVLGELSAKNLRGESMADVIFNGSELRKASGQCSIELLFDNSMGKLGGEYSKYNEISVKRVMTRDGQSNYFINKAKVRRKDVQDIFLGTGLGPNSYAIIEQGMVSKIVSARPEDLRIYIEEAAGISKYKERRKETESKIKRTKENISRVKDIRDEIKRLIGRLERQAKAAEKYNELSSQETDIKLKISIMNSLSAKTQRDKINLSLRDLTSKLKVANGEVLTIQSKIDQIRTEHQDTLAAYDEAQKSFYGVGSELARLEESLQNLTSAEANTKTDIIKANQAYEDAMKKATDFEELSPKEKALHILEKLISSINKSELKELALQLKEILHKVLNIASEQTKDFAQEFKQRIDELELKLDEISKKKSETQDLLTKQVEMKSSSESGLLKIKQAQSKVTDEINHLENQKGLLQIDEKNLEEKINQNKLDLRTFEINLENSSKLLEKNNINIEDLDPSDYNNFSLDGLESDLNSVQNKITSLGAINLAAPEEIKSESERMSELDRQINDLNQALDKLQIAIQKIDNESRSKFESSFKAVNEKISEIFPTLFGGGKAELRLLEGDALSSGVALMATPPGKKNSNISQLSGGEKALTALSLVFALFKLNPAPFCMLDEVDAPLDDLNTTRFVNMVESMSPEVQFIFITHNKISMEKSDHLMGITMQEAGVSRVVSVDVSEALELAAS